MHTVRKLVWQFIDGLSGSQSGTLRENSRQSLQKCVYAFKRVVARRTAKSRRAEKPAMQKAVVETDHTCPITGGFGRWQEPF